MTPHIVSIIPNYHPVPLTGADRYLGRIAELIAEAGSTSTIITTDVPSARGWYLPTSERDRLPEHATINRVTVKRYRPIFPISAAAYLLGRWLPASPRPTVRTRPTLSDRVQSLATGPFFAQLTAHCRALGATAIHAGPFPLTHVLMAQSVAKRLDLPFVLTPVFHFELPNYYNPVYTNLLIQADRVIALTEFERRELIERFSLDPTRVVIVPFGLDTTILDRQPVRPGAFRKRHRIPADQRVVLYAGSKGIDKGAIDVLAVTAALNRPDVTLVALGLPTPDWTTALETTRPRHLVDLGYVTEREKWEAFADADIVAVPMRANAFGLVFLEGWYFRKAVIGGLVGAASEIVTDGVNGCLVPFGDRLVLRTKLTELVDDPARCRSFGRAGHRRLADYSDQAMARAVNRAFQSEPGVDGASAKGSSQTGHRRASRRQL